MCSSLMILQWWVTCQVQPDGVAHLDIDPFKVRN
jgi:hypothetical protein